MNINSLTIFIQLSELRSWIFHLDTLTVQQPLINTQKAKEALEPKIKAIAAKPLTHPILCRYLNERKIPIGIAQSIVKRSTSDYMTRDILPSVLKTDREDLS